MNFKKKKRKERLPVTLLIIPDLNNKPFNYTMTRKRITGTLGIVACFVLAFLILAYSHLIGLNDIRNVQNIKQESNAKASTIKQMNQEINEMKMQQEEVERKQQEIKKLMGVEKEIIDHPNPSRGGQGGDDREIGENEEAQTFILVQNIKTSLARQEKELDDMLAQVKNDQAYFRALPNLWPADGEISSDYGLRKSPWTKKDTFHEGIDIKNQVGTDIVAAADGKVIYAGWMAVYGKTVVIDHGNGLESKYGHNSALQVEKGDIVTKGEVIARMGTTGLSTGPHLHFAITKNGQIQDPMIYLP
ncbi:MAG: M23 family metallopeptidase [Syntrophomonas sp.]|nr:M23 family metallopeptidase [Syntrophomonas sp.]